MIIEKHAAAPPDNSVRDRWAPILRRGLVVLGAGLLGISAGALTDTAEETRFFEIKSRQLATALREVATQSGYQLIFATETIANVASKPLIGSHSVPEALRIVLQDTAFSFEITPNKVIVIRGSQSVPAAGNAATGGTGLTNAASGPQKPAQAGRTIEELLVTAQRREELLRDIPIAASVFSAAQLQELGARDPGDLGYRVPNLAITWQGPSLSTANISIRGFNNSETQLIQESKVGIYIDGILIGKATGAVFDTPDIQRIEVLRGSQGTLFGRNTTGGAINIVTRKPAGVFAGELSASAGKFGYRRWQGSLDLPRMAGVSTRFSASHMQTDGWADNNYRGDPIAGFPRFTVAEDLASEDNHSARFSLRWEPHDDVLLDYSFDRTDNRGVATPYQITQVKESYRELGGVYSQMMADIGDPGRRRREWNLDGMGENWLDLQAHTLNLSWMIAGQTSLKYIYGDRRTSLGVHSTDYDGGAHRVRDLFYGALQGISTPLPTPVSHSANPGSSLATQSHEIQLTGEAPGGDLLYTAGIYHYRETVKEQALLAYSFPVEALLADSPALRELYESSGYCLPHQSGSLCPGSQRLPLPSRDTGTPGVIDLAWGGTSYSSAAYGQLTYALSEQLAVSIGLRFTKDEKDQFLYNESFADITREPPASATGNWSQWTYMSNLSYKIADHSNIYLKYSTGYNSGGFNGRSTSSDAFKVPYDEERVGTWELGLKSYLFDERLRLDITLFNSRFRDVQVQQFETGAGGTTSRTVNAGSSNLKGLEVDLAAALADHWTLELAFGYLNARFEEYLQPDSDTGEPVDIADIASVPTAPRRTASLGLRYDFPSGRFGHPSLRLDAAYRDEFSYSYFPARSLTANAHTLLDARFSLRQIPMGDSERSLQVSLWGKNLTDREYQTFGVDFGALGFAGVTYGAPRSFGADIVYSF